MFLYHKSVFSGKRQLPLLLPLSMLLATALKLQLYVDPYRIQTDLLLNLSFSLLTFRPQIET